MNKKKIFIGIGTILILIILVCLLVILKNKNIKNNDTEMLEKQAEIPENIPTEETNTNVETQTLDIPENSAETQPVETPKEVVIDPIQKESLENNQNTNKTTEKNQKEVIKQPNSNTNQTQTNNKAQINSSKEIPKSSTTEKNTDNQQIVTQPQETKEDIKPNENKQEEKIEKYVRNDDMINKIKQVILSNESNYMKQHGYEIVVDSSIKEKTNQFTYTENRVKSYLTYKFGTIRIYAEDYYVNSTLIMTECYIL